MAFTDHPLTNWQKNYKTWPERMNFIKQKEGLADFKFIVGPEKTVFHAHKLIFAISSPEFENLFYLVRSDMNEINLPQNSPEIFKEFLNFVYTGIVEITLENVGEILKLSRLYDITLLTNKCDDYLQKTISKDNVFQILEISSELSAELECLKVIGENFIELFQCEEFVKISKSSLQKIVEYEMLPCREIVLFEAVDKWAENAQLKAKSKNRREHVNELIPKIRFGSMSSDEFVMKCAVDSILTSSEIIDIVKYLASPTSSIPFFINKKRLIETNIDELPLQKCLRFNDSPIAGCSLGGCSDFYITVDKPVYLCGYGIYGRRPEALELYKTALVDINISDDGDNSLREKSEEITFDGTTKIFEIFFNSPVLLKPFKSYNVFINMSGPVLVKPTLEHFCGQDGRTEIKENGVTFKLTNNWECPFDTARIGTIAALLFKN